MANKSSNKNKRKTAAKTKKTTKNNSSILNEKEQKIKAGIKGMQDERNEHRLVNDIIWGVLYIAVGAFIFIAVEFNAAGEFGNALGEILKGLFGFIGLILPWYLCLIGLLLIFQKALHFSKKTIFAGLVILLMICIINSGRFIDENNLIFSMVKFYEDGKTLQGGGGIGMPLAIVLVKWFGKAGLYIFSVVITLIALLFLVKTPLSSYLESLAEKREEKRLTKERLSEYEFQDYDISGESQVEPLTNLKSADEFECGVKSKKKKKSYFSKDKLRNNSINQAAFTGIWEENNYPEFNVVPSDNGIGLEKPYETQDGYGLYGDDIKISKSHYEEELSECSIKSIESDNYLDSDVDITPYEEKKASSAEIAKGAAEIGENLGLNGGNTTLTKSADRSTIKIYRKPPIKLLNKPKVANNAGITNDLKAKAALLEKTLKNFNVEAKVVQVTQGPAVTRYEIQPDTGVKVSKIVNLSDDIALNLRAKSIRMEAPIPGKAAVGIEVENDKINMVTLREIVDSQEFNSAKSKIEFAVGKDIAGKPIVADLKSMPHLLIAGSTGSGKSVCINSIILSILYRAEPDEVKFVLIDPKVVELGNYNGIPHLLIPVVTDPSKAAAALSWAVVEMTNRYKAFAEANVRDLASYNKKMKSQGSHDLVMPQIVIVIDELADLMMVAPSQVEDSICRLAQLARAAGMHLIVATQRPSVDVITGVIKANIPSRIAFAVSSMADSRTILDRGGAEHLVGKGDMLFKPLGIGNATRVQGTFVSDDEVERVLEYLKSQNEETEYSEEVIDTIENGNSNIFDKKDDADELLADAIEFVVMQGQASVSSIQRRFRVGYNRGARIMDEMEARGIVSSQDGSKPRQVLMTEDELRSLEDKLN